MKNEILDDIPIEGIYSALKKGEKIIWEGKPSHKSLFDIFEKGTSIGEILTNGLVIIMFIFFGFMIIFFFYYGPWLAKLFFVIFFFVFSAASRAYFFKGRKVKYLVTDQRIILQLPDGVFKKKIHELPLEEIKDLVTTKPTGRYGEGNHGSIYFAIKNPKIITFDTYDLISGELRQQPSFEKKKM